MKHLLIFSIAATLVLLMNSAQSQAPVAASSVAAQLQAIQAANKTLIEQQNKTLQTLDEMKQTAEQIKAFAKRG